MNNQEIDQFELNFKNVRITVQKHIIEHYIVFKIGFPDKRRPLMITRATDACTQYYWTSIPAGRQEEAEEIGIRISGYLESRWRSVTTMVRR